MISQLGTFDVENYGDLLYPLVFRHLLEKRDASLRVRQYSLLPGHAPLEAGFETYPITSLFEAETVEPLRLVVGGGDILRTDWKTVAAPYSRIHRGYLHKLRNSLGTTGTLRYLLLKPLPGPFGSRFFVDRFRKRRMSYTAAGPFLMDPTVLPVGEVAYLSCGVPHDFLPADRNKVRRTFDRAQFIYLRDELSAEKLRRCGVRRQIHVAPDLIVTLSDQFEHAAEARKGRKILSKLGVNDERPILCFQSKPYFGFRAAEIVQHLHHYRRKTGSEVVLLPVGYCHDDHGFLQGLAKKSGGTFKYAKVYSVFDIISVIAASNLFVGTSLHGNITAFSFGIPHLFGPLPVAKTEGFLSAVNLPRELKLRTWDELNDKLGMIEALGRNFFTTRARKAKARVYAVVDELLESLLA